MRRKEVVTCELQETGSREQLLYILYTDIDSFCVAEV